MADAGGVNYNYKVQQTFTGHERTVASVKLSPDAAVVASCSADKSIRLWNASSGEQVGLLTGHAGGVNDVAYHPSGRYVASASDDQTLRLWDVERGISLNTLKKHTHYVMCCNFHPFGNILVSGSFDETVRLWDVRCGDCIKEIPAHSDPVSAVEFSSGRDGGAMLVSASFDGLIRIWETYSGHCLKTLLESTNPPVTHIKISPNSKYLIANGLDSQIRLWNISDVQRGGQAKVSRHFAGHENKHYCVFSTFGQKECVISGSEDHKVYIWSVKAKVEKPVAEQNQSKRRLAQPIHVLPGRNTAEEAGEGHCDTVLCLDHSTSDCSVPTLVTGSMEKDATIKLWKPA